MGQADIRIVHSQFLEVLKMEAFWSDRRFRNLARPVHAPDFGRLNWGYYSTTMLFRKAELCDS